MFPTQLWNYKIVFQKRIQCIIFRTLYDHGCSQLSCVMTQRCSKAGSNAFAHFLIMDVPKSALKLQKGVPKQGPEGSILTFCGKTPVATGMFPFISPSQNDRFERDRRTDMWRTMNFRHTYTIALRANIVMYRQFVFCNPHLNLILQTLTPLMLQLIATQCSWEYYRGY